MTCPRCDGTPAGGVHALGVDPLPEEPSQAIQGGTYRAVTCCGIDTTTTPVRLAFAASDIDCPVCKVLHGKTAFPFPFGP